jgi:anaerobic selenocysteine-containing dehydrogenase
LAAGARLVVVDPRRVGFARRADQWLRVRPGTDGALALSLAHVMIDRGWFDLEFVGRWTNGPFLVRSDTGRFLRESDLVPSGSESRYVLWDDASDRPVFGGSGGPREPSNPRLFGEVEVSGVAEGFRCRPAFHLLADLCRQHAPERAEKVTGVPAEQIRETARLLWEARPMAFYAWSGVEQHTNTTQTVRAIGQLQALTGSFDARGGNVLFPSVPTNPIDGLDLIPAQRRRRALGLDTHPLGPPRWEFVSSDAFYTAALEGHPYRARGLVGFGANLLLAQADGRRGREALAALDFYMHADLFMNPTAHMADVVLPVTSPFESEGLQVGFEINPEAQSLVQLRKPLVDPRGEARSDIRIVFELATRLGLGHHFWQGDIDAAWSHQLEPSGLTLDTLRERPEGVRLPLEARYWKFAEDDGRGPRGFSTPTGRIELYSETFLEHGYSPLPEFREPALSPHARPDLGRRFPLVLTSSKSLWYCESQQRALPGLRRRAPDPAVDLHPDAARSRGIAEGDWVRIETPNGSVRARARFDANLAPDVVCGQHGWWQACPELGEDVLLVGGGGAGLRAAIAVAEHNPGLRIGVSPRSIPCGATPSRPREGPRR